MKDSYKVLVIVSLSFFLNLTTKAQTSERDSVSSRVILYMPGITVPQLNSVKLTFSTIPEITEASFIGGQHNCLIVNIDKAAGNNIVFNYDLLKRLSVSYSYKDIRIKESSSFEEIMKTTGADIINFIK